MSDNLKWIIERYKEGTSESPAMNITAPLLRHFPSPPQSSTQLSLCAPLLHLQLLQLFWATPLLPTSTSTTDGPCTAAAVLTLQLSTTSFRALRIATM